MSVLRAGGPRIYRGSEGFAEGIAYWKGFEVFTRWALFGFFLAASIAVLAQAPAVSPRPTLIRAGRLLDVRAGKYLLDQGVLIENGRVKTVGPWARVSASAPNDTNFVDLSKTTVLPGLIDCHAHLLAAMDLALDPGSNIVLTVTQIAPTKRVLLGAAMARQDLDAGFTTVRNVGHSGIDGDVSLRDAINEDLVSGPRILASARKLTPPGGQAVRVQPAVSETILEQEYLPVDGAEEGRKAVRKNAYIGADLIKVVVDDPPRVLSVEELRAIVDEAHVMKMKVAAHATTRQGIRNAAEAGVDSVEHGDEVDDDTLKLMHDKGIYLDATDLFIGGRILSLVESRLVLTPKERKDLADFQKRFDEQSKNRLWRAIKAGVRIIAGSDQWMTYPGKTRGQATLIELEALQDQGMQPAEVLRASTMTAAEALGWQDQVGTLEPGHFADLIALDGDPLRDVKELEKVQFVMKGGTVVRNDLRSK